MGEACSTQGASAVKNRLVVRGPCAVHVPSAVHQEHSLNEGRRFKDEYEVSSRLAPKVRVVRNKVTKATYVAYTLQKKNLPCRDVEKMARSIRCLQGLDHPNVCRLLEAFEDHSKETSEDMVHLIYAQAIGIPLLKYVAQYGFSEETAANLVQQVTRALKHGDESGVCHGAVVPKNIFVSSTGKVMMTDFGLAYLLKPPPLESACEEDFAFLPPEALQPWLEAAVAHTDRWGRQKHVDTMSKPAEGSKAWKKEHVRKDFWASAGDMWSLGVILFKLLRGHMPFRAHGKGPLGLAHDVVNHKLDIKLDFHDILSDEACDVLRALLNKNPARRPCSEELLQHEWILKHIQKSAAPVKRNICKELSTFVAETHFKKMVMRMLVTKLPPRRIAALQEAFESMDANHDGQVTLLELKRGLARFPEICEGLDAPIDDVFSAIDTDKGGKVSLHEFLAATLDAHDVVTDAAIIDAFRCLDTNGDGKLCKDELAIAVREIDGHLGPSHIEDLVRKLEGELGHEPLDMKAFLDLIKEEGQHVARNQVVAKEAASQSWSCCLPLAVQRSEVAKVVAASTGENFTGVSSRISRMSAETRKSSRSPKRSPRASSAHKDSLDSKRSPRSGRGRSPGQRCSKYQEAARASAARYEDPSSSLKDYRSCSPASSDCSTECSSSPTKGGLIQGWLVKNTAE